MTETSDSHFDRIDTLCDAFEAEWSVESRPSIEGYLDAVEDALRPRLLNALLAIECELLRKARQTPSQESYQQRFPAYRAEISAVFRLLRGSDASRTILGNYELLEKIGEGGMGAVYKARHTSLNKIMAVKLLTHNSLDNEQAIARFRREMEVVGKLHHPNIVHALDAGEIDGTPYLAMEFIEGTDLSTLAKTSPPLPVSDTIDFVMQAARGLEHAHQRGIIHRDIKPANLMLDKKGVIRVLDMGLARFEQAAVVQHAAGLTQSGVVMGTVDYMSPEQALDSKQADHRSDIYSLGCTLFRLIAGKVIYDLDSLTQRLLAHREAPIPLLAEQRSDVPAALELLFRQMVAKLPADRPQSMAEVAARLERIQLGVEDPAPLYTEQKNTSQVTVATFKSRLRRYAALMTIYCLIAFGVASILAYVTPGDSSDPQGSVPVLPRPKTANARTEVGVSAPIAVNFDSERKVIPIQESCQGNVDISAVFAAEWINATELKLTLQQKDRHELRYDFVVRPAESQQTPLGDEPPRGSSFAALQAAEGYCELMILRNGVALQSQRTPLAKVGQGRLRLRVQRIDDSLMCQINTAPPTEILDPFPLDATTMVGVVTTDNGVALAEITCHPNDRRYTKSILNDADRLFEARRYEEALARYQRLASDGSAKTSRPEALYKQGLCLDRLSRFKDAQQIWRQLISQWEDDARWSLLARAQLWLVQLAVTDELNVDSFEQYFAKDVHVIRLRQVGPLSLRDAIRDRHIDQDQFAKYALFKPDRRKRLRRFAELDPLLDASGLPTDKGLLAQINEWEFLSDIGDPVVFDRTRLTQAMAAARQWRTLYPTSKVGVFRLARLLSLTAEKGSPAASQAVRMIEQLVTDEARYSSSRRLCSIVHLAQIRAAMQQVPAAVQCLNQAEELVKEIELAGARVSPYNVGLIHLVRGFLLADRNLDGEASHAWQQGTLDLRARLTERDEDPTGMIALVFFSLAGLSGDLLQSDVDKFFHPSRFLNIDSLQYRELGREITRAKNLARWIPSALRTARGRELCRGFAFDTLVVRDHLQWPVIIATDFISREAFSQQLFEEQEQEVWQLANGIMEDLAFRGQIDLESVGSQLAANWLQGTIAWKPLCDATPSPLRARYVLAHYLAVDHDQPRSKTGGITANAKLATDLLIQVVEGTKARAGWEKLHTLAEQDLELLKSDAGMIQFRRVVPATVFIKIRQEDRQVRQLEVNDGQPQTMNLPSGKYHIAIQDVTGKVLLEQELQVVLLSRQTILIPSVSPDVTK